MLLRGSHRTDQKTGDLVSVGSAPSRLSRCEPQPQIRHGQKTEYASRPTPTGRTLVTFSWDDGHPLDMRIAELMANHGLPATFYIPINITGPTLDPHQLIDLAAMGMEIGSHGLSHSQLTHSCDAQKELVESKAQLEEIIGAEISSFCYPFGSFNRRLASLARLAGYSLARTTVGFSINRDFDIFSMPVTLQFAPHRRLTRLRRSIKENNVRGILNWTFRWQFETDLMRLSLNTFEDARREHGIFHVWGHSWEIESLGLWHQLTDLCSYIAGRSDVKYLTNSSVGSEICK
jgi:peptidoglycan/xylan/chitin deacetylase (PgdA/CDA1 family)